VASCVAEMPFINRLQVCLIKCEERRWEFCVNHGVGCILSNLVTITRSEPAQMYSYLLLAYRLAEPILCTVLFSHEINPAKLFIQKNRPTTMLF
jgi:hypothetical protein